jgi:glycogen debranching enzyme
MGKISYGFAIFFIVLNISYSSSISLLQQLYSHNDAIVLSSPKDNILYDYGNIYLMAQSDSENNINKYWVVNKKEPILKENGFVSHIKIDNNNISKPDIIYARSGLFTTYYKHQNCDLYVTTFTDNETNAILQRYNIVNNRGCNVRISLNISLDLGGNDNLNYKAYKTENGNDYILATNNNGDRAAAIGTSLTFDRYDFFKDSIDITYYLKGNNKEEYYVYLSGGFDLDNELRTAKLIDKKAAKLFENAINRANWIDNLFQIDDKILDSMFSAAVDCALSNYKVDESANFKAFYAGVRYREPARTYYRDSYWTTQSLLPFRPDLVRNQIIALSKGIHDNGVTGSGVKFDGSDWWSYHYDSPSFFVMMLYDYISFTGDISILWENTKGKSYDDGNGNIKFSEEKSVWQKAKRTIDWLKSTDLNKNYLVEKPLNVFGDWADEVARINEVTYVNVLYYKALLSLSEMAPLAGESGLETVYKEMAKKVREAVNKDLWDKTKGYYINFQYAPRDVALYKENNFSEDTLLAALYGVATGDQIKSMLNYANKFLNTKNNTSQPFGDWGVMCVWPLYKNTTYRRPRESDDPYRYHNGADWPYLDGINALVRLKYNDKNWRYPLIRWWQHSLSEGLLTPVEYYQPKYPNGGFRQAWSAMPAAAIVMGGYGVSPSISNGFTPIIPPWGNSSLNFIYKGNTYKLEIKKSNIHLNKNNAPIEYVNNEQIF